MSAGEFNELLFNNADSLKPFAVSLTNDQDSAKDLYQETLYKALANREKYKRGTNIKAWLFTIMRNIFINEYRRKAKRKTIFENTTDHALINSANIVVANGADGSILLQEINRALYRLPRIFKVPFLLYFEGYRYQEIAYSLKEPLGTIKSRIHVARKILKDQVNREVKEYLWHQ